MMSTGPYLHNQVTCGIVDRDVDSGIDQRFTMSIGRGGEDNGAFTLGHGLTPNPTQFVLISSSNTGGLWAIGDGEELSQIGHQ